MPNLVLTAPQIRAHEWPNLWASCYLIHSIIKFIMNFHHYELENCLLNHHLWGHMSFTWPLYWSAWCLQPVYFTFYCDSTAHHLYLISSSRDGDASATEEFVVKLALLFYKIELETLSQPASVRMWSWIMITLAYRYRVGQNTGSRLKDPA